MRLSPCRVMAFAICLSPTLAQAEINASIDRRIPDEYESVGGHAAGMDNAGVAALGGISSIRVNPGMMAMEPQYSASAGYVWPTTGRDFFQAGIVDTKTASFAAGVIYTGSLDKHEEDFFKETERDSPVDRRGALALAKTFRSLSVGVNAEYVQANIPDKTQYRQKGGVTAGLGLAGLLTPQLRVGLSAENLANQQIRDYAPTTYRAGLAYLMNRGDVTANLDLRQRERVESVEGDLADLGGSTTGFRDPERMAIVSFSAKMFDVLRLLGAYGLSLTSEDPRQSVSGGIALVNNAFSLSYSASKPYLKYRQIQHAVNLGVMLNM